MKLSNYFQECSIEMDVGSRDKKTVILFPSTLTMEQSLDLTLFTITDYALVKVKASDPWSGLRMTIRMKRKIMSEKMTTYFPSLLLMMITGIFLQ